jgi:hypothetical protein
LFSCIAFCCNHEILIVGFPIPLHGEAGIETSSIRELDPMHFALQYSMAATTQQTKEKQHSFLSRDFATYSPLVFASSFE